MMVNTMFWGFCFVVVLVVFCLSECLGVLLVVVVFFFDWWVLFCCLFVFVWVCVSFYYLEILVFLPSIISKDHCSKCNQNILKSADYFEGGCLTDEEQGCVQVKGRQKMGCQQFPVAPPGRAQMSSCVYSRLLNFTNWWCSIAGGKCCILLWRFQICVSGDVLAHNSLLMMCWGSRQKGRYID